MKQISLNFGAIKDTVFKFAAKSLMIEGKENTNILKEFLKEIKSNHVLKLQYLIFKNLSEGNFKKERLAERYLNENLKIANKINWGDLLETNKKIRSRLLENCHVEGAPGMNELYENIHVLIESTIKPDFQDINKSQRAYEYILEYLTKDVEDISEKRNKETSDSPNLFSWKFIINHAVSNFNERYSHLNEAERNTLKVLLSDYKNKINHLDHIKKESIDLINKILIEKEDDSTKSIMKKFENKINSLPKVNKENIDEIIINCSELNESLKNF